MATYSLGSCWNRSEAKNEIEMASSMIYHDLPIQNRDVP